MIGGVTPSTLLPEDVLVAKENLASAVMGIPYLETNCFTDQVDICSIIQHNLGLPQNQFLVAENHSLC